MSTREDDLDYFRNFVTDALLRFAKTYVEIAPARAHCSRGLMVIPSREPSGGMSLRLLKFGGGSVDDYAICRSS
jgi:hypothetical protein